MASAWVSVLVSSSEAKTTGSPTRGTGNVDKVEQILLDLSLSQPFDEEARMYEHLANHQASVGFRCVVELST